MKKKKTIWTLTTNRFRGRQRADSRIEKLRLSISAKGIIPVFNLI